jgi:hypothetical protein
VWLCDWTLCDLVECYRQFIITLWSVLATVTMTCLPSAYLHSQGVHISKLGIIAPLCSHKDPPGQDLCIPLTETILIEGFKTASEPLIGTQPESLGHRGLININDQELGGPGMAHPLASQSLGYIKGLGRTSTISGVLLWCKLNSRSLVDEHPVLHKSLHQIYVYHFLVDNEMEQMLKNLKISCTGSLRKAPNVITLVSMCSKLMKKGMEDWGDFIRRFNILVPRIHKIQGQRSMTLKFLFTLASPEFVEVPLCLKQVLEWLWWQNLFIDQPFAQRCIFG